MVPRRFCWSTQSGTYFIPVLMAAPPAEVFGASQALASVIE